MNIGEGIRLTRKEKKVSQFSLSKLIELSHTTVCNLERSYFFPRNATLIKIADSLKVSVDYLMLNSIEDKYILSDDKIKFEIYMRELKDILKRANKEIYG